MYGITVFCNYKKLAFFLSWLLRFLQRIETRFCYLSLYYVIQNKGIYTSGGGGGGKPPPPPKKKKKKNARFTWCIPRSFSSPLKLNSVFALALRPDLNTGLKSNNNHNRYSRTLWILLQNLMDPTPRPWRSATPLSSTNWAVLRPVNPTSSTTSSTYFS